MRSHVKFLEGVVILVSVILTACSEYKFDRKPNVDHDYTVNSEDALPQQKVDILFVVDNSASMQPEQAKMADRFVTFISSLANIDWRIAITTTDVMRNQGRLLNFDAARTILSTQDGDADFLFRQTIQRTETGTGDERGIYATNLALDKNVGQLVRRDAHFTTIVLTDEDERSTGGKTRPLENYDLPDTYIAKVKEKLGPDKSSTFHSIIIKPGDSSCLGIQSDQSNKGYEGKIYAQLSGKTQGVVGDICASDYGGQLSSIGQTIQKQMMTMNLKCEPINNSFQVTMNPSIPGLSTTVEGTRLSFNQLIPNGTQIHLRYTCRG